MANIITDSQHYSNIANNLRQTINTDSTYKPAEMADAILTVYDAGYNKGKAEGGGSVISEAWQRPSNWPDLSSLGKPEPGTTYLTFDCRDAKQGINYDVYIVGFTINGYTQTIERGYVENGVFISVDTIPFNRDTLINLDMDNKDFVVYKLSGVRCIGISGKNHRQLTVAPLLEMYGTAVPGIDPFYGGNSYTGTFASRTKSVIMYDVDFNGELHSSTYPYPVHIELINIKDWKLNSDKVTSMARFLSGFTHLKTVTLPFNTTQVTNMSRMFNECYLLEDIDISTFDTSNVTDMSYMFAQCMSIKKLDLKHFNTSKVKNFNMMFDSCYSLYELDFSSLDTSAVTAGSTINMLNACDNLTNLILGKITTNFKINNCNKLSHDSLINIIAALEPTDSTLVLTIGSNNLAKLTDEEIAVATEKGWSLV